MNAGDLSGFCPLCREPHAGGCTVLSSMSIVLFEIDAATSAEDLARAEAALVALLAQRGQFLHGLRVSLLIAAGVALTAAAVSLFLRATGDVTTGQLR